MLELIAREKSISLRDKYSAGAATWGVCRPPRLGVGPGEGRSAQAAALMNFAGGGFSPASAAGYPHAPLTRPSLRKAPVRRPDEQETLDGEGDQHLSRHAQELFQGFGPVVHKVKLSCGDSGVNIGCKEL